MHIICNGQKRELKKGTTLAGLLGELQLVADAVVIELNRTIIDLDQYEATCLQDGDQVELIRFVGGG